VPIWKAIILGIVEGLTEFLPISSTGHLTFVEKLLDLPIDSKAVTGFTAVIQVGAIAAVVHYFRDDIVRILRGWFAGLRHRDRRNDFEYRFGWIVIVGSIPVGLVGLAARDLITGELRNLWWVAGALIGWSAVMVAAERVATQRRGETDTRIGDGAFIGVLQCFSLIPGVSRSGATISAGLFRDLDRVTATRLSFFLAIPALVAAGAYELKDAVSSGVGWGATLVGTAISFAVAYATVVWLIRFVAHHPISRFAWYRVALGVLIVGLLASGAMGAT
jgi:undecaprenyl-diphosphatase